LRIVTKLSSAVAEESPSPRMAETADRRQSASAANLDAQADAIVGSVEVVATPDVRRGQAMSCQRADDQATRAGVLDRSMSRYERIDA
jgi:hypothetical protein